MKILNNEKISRQYEMKIESNYARHDYKDADAFNNPISLCYSICVDCLTVKQIVFNFRSLQIQISSSPPPPCQVHRKIAYVK